MRRPNAGRARVSDTVDRSGSARSCRALLESFCLLRTFSTVFAQAKGEEGEK